MSIDRLILVGAGGHARVVFDAARAARPTTAIEVRDDFPRSPEPALGGLPILTPAWPADGARGQRVHVAIGDGEARQRLAERFISGGASLVEIRHPRAVVADTARVESGTFVAANAIIGPAATVGRGAIVNHSAIVDHDCRVGEWCHVAPGAILGGGVVLGAGVMVGAGAVVLPGVQIGAGATIGAGAVVTRPVKAGSVMVGVPARGINPGGISQ